MCSKSYLHDWTRLGKKTFSNQNDSIYPFLLGIFLGLTLAI